MARYKLKLKRLDFISPVDVPAQETARVLAIKRAGDRRELDGFARVAKINEELGLVFCWAFTSKAAGADYFDLHGDNIDDDFVRVCAEFMEGARATDEMHDGEQDGRVIFGMPMTPEVAKIYGVTTDTNGFMVALKPSADVLEKFKSGEYTGVSIAGLGEREKLTEKAAVSKRAALTTATNGHTHLVPWVDEQQSGTTSSDYSPGTDYSYHSHPWVKTEDGSIVIGEAGGHTHELATMKRAPRAGDDGDDGSPAPAVASKSTTANATPTVKATTPLQPQEPSNMTTEADLKKRIADLETELTIAKKHASLTDAQRAHMNTLSVDAAASFLSKSFDERQAVLVEIEKRNEVVYTSKSNGRIFRKSDEASGLVDLAKQLDDQAEQLAKRDAEVEKQAIRNIAKARIPNLQGGDDVHDYIVKSLQRGGGDAALVEKALDAVASGSNAMKSLGKPAGANPGGDAEPRDPLAAFNDGVKKYAEAKGIKDEGLALEKFLATDEGKTLKKAYDASRAYGRQA